MELSATTGSDNEVICSSIARFSDLGNILSGYEMVSFESCYQSDLLIRTVAVDNQGHFNNE